MSTDKGLYPTNVENRTLDSKLLEVDFDYQRMAKDREVDEIIKRFNPRLVNDIKVSFRDGKYYVIDGQHTLTALRKKNGGNHLLVRCKVYYGLTEQQEAQMFLDQNGYVSSIYWHDKIKAGITAHDPKTVGFLKALAKLGFKISEKGERGDNIIVASAKAFSIYKEVSEPEFMLLFRTLKKAWGGKQESLSRDMIGGLYEFFKAHAGEFDIDTLVSKLSAIPPHEIIRDARILPCKGDMRYANWITRIYNKRLKGHRLHEIYS